MHAAFATVLGVLVAWPCVPQDATPKPATVKIGERVAGEVRADSALVHTPTLDQNYTDVPVRGVVYKVELPAATVSDAVTIELRSYFFDAYLVVRDAKGELIAEDDDGLLRTHSRVVLKSEAAGTFEVEVCALHGGTGPFELRVATGVAPSLDARRKQEAEIEDARKAAEVVETVRGPEHADTATSLNNFASLLKDDGRYEEARPLFERALAIQEKTRGADHPDTATILSNLAEVLESEGKYEEARPLAERALAIDEKVFGAESPYTATSLNNLAGILRLEGKYEEARPLYQRALAIDEKVLGAEHPYTATSLNCLALVLHAEGKLEEARPLLERALAIDEKVLGAEDADTATSLGNLARLLHDEGKYEEARPLCQRALAIREKVLGAEHPYTASSLNDLALLLRAEGRYEEARPLHERAHAIYEKVSGPEHPDTAASLDNLAELLQAESRYEEARPLYERALAIREKVRGAEHQDTATSLNNLAALLHGEGKFEEARRLFERALAIEEKMLGAEHPATAMSLHNLAVLLENEGKYEEARPLYERALAIQEKVLGAEHPATARSLSDLAGLLENEGEYEQAQRLDQRALAIDEKALGPEHPDTATDLNNLAVLFKHQGKCEEARPLYERALAIYEKVQGPEHPDTARSLNNLALLLQDEGKYEEARPLHERALKIQEKVLGPEHPATARSLGWLAVNDLDRGAPARARAFAERQLTSVQAHAFEEATRAAASDAMREFSMLNDAVTCLLAAATPAERASDATYAKVLLEKGAAFRTLSGRWRTLVERGDGATRATLDRMQSVRAAMSNLYSTRVVKNRDEYEHNLERLRKERAECETKLAQIVAARPELQPTTPKEVRAALPEDAVLLDFLEHQLYAPAEWRDGKVVKLGTWSEPRFSVWISRRGAAAATWVDLGPSEEIEREITRHLGAVVGIDAIRGVRGAGGVAPLGDASSSSQRLRELLWDPIAARLGEGANQKPVKRVIVAADGALATLPFGLIVDASGHHLIEQYAFTQIEDASTLARPLRAVKDERGSPSSAVATTAPSLLVTGAIAYDHGARVDDSLASSHELRGSFTSTWDSLSETRREVDGIAARHLRRFETAPRLVLLDDAPTEERLKAELPKYSVLHLATHGYFYVDGLPSITDTLSEKSERARFETDERGLVAGYWPQFLCGVVCAGANHPEPNRDNGLLTGDEVSGLDLSHCDLVVLSACETALGKRQAGEGALSLTRSFREAGARTVISSMWQVRDDSTKDLMLDFYDRLWNQHESKLDALRDAQLHMLKENREKYGDTRPATWGAFVLTGETE